MTQTIHVEGSTLEIDLVPSSDPGQAHLVIHSSDLNQSLIVFLHEASALREALSTAVTKLAQMNVEARRRRESI